MLTISRGIIKPRKQEKMTLSVKNAIIDDLLTKRPSGPFGTHVIHEEREFYDSNSGTYKTEIISTNCDNFGWSNKQLFDLNIHTEHSCKTYICKRFYNEDYVSSLTKGKKIAVSRRTNRLWRRLEAAVDAVKEEGGDGIYRVEKRWFSSPLGYLVARDKETAIAMAKLFYGFMCEDGKLVAEYVRSGDYSHVRKLNAELIESAQNDIKRRKERIDEIKQTIDKKNLMIDAIKTVDRGQVSVTAVK